MTERVVKEEGAHVIRVPLLLCLPSGLDFSAECSQVSDHVVTLAAA